MKRIALFIMSCFLTFIVANELYQVTITKDISGLLSLNFIGLLCSSIFFIYSFIKSNNEATSIDS
jgi:hypothetical protein